MECPGTRVLLTLAIATQSLLSVSPHIARAAALVPERSALLAAPAEKGGAPGFLRASLTFEPRLAQEGDRITGTLHIDADGTDSPAILLDLPTALASRAHGSLKAFRCMERAFCCASIHLRAASSATSTRVASRR